jgi:hypothetical protein
LPQLSILGRVDALLHGSVRDFPYVETLLPDAVGHLRSWGMYSAVSRRTSPGGEVGLGRLQNRIAITVNWYCADQEGIGASGEGILRGPGRIRRLWRGIWICCSCAIFIDREVFEEKGPFIFAILAHAVLTSLSSRVKPVVP